MNIWVHDLTLGTGTALHKGIDAELAEFLAQASVDKKGQVIDEATNRRLRWLIHKRILVCRFLIVYSAILTSIGCDGCYVL